MKTLIRHDFKVGRHWNRLSGALSFPKYTITFSEVLNII